MKYFPALLTILFLSASASLSAQEEELRSDYEEEEEEPAYVSKNEIGFDLNFSASNFGGTGGLGLKLGFIQQERFIFGPSIRYQHAWSSFNGIKTGFSIYGGGGFVHWRLANYFFLGTEIEVLSSPLQYGYITSNRSWVPVALVGGGFSRAFSANFRLNAGIMYDVIDNQNSPLRQGYFMKKTNGVLIPVIYRIAFFFPL
jgi:hypothetical protein